MKGKCTISGIYTEKGKKFKFPSTEVILEDSGIFILKSNDTIIDGSIKNNSCQFTYIKKERKLQSEGIFTGSTLKGNWKYNNTDFGEFELNFDGYKNPKKEKQIIKEIPYGKCKGFYYEGGEKHDMDLELGLMDDGVFIGKGKDDKGEFELTGAFSQYDSCEVNITKMYAGKDSIILYNGVFENAVIKGLWMLEDELGEEFEINMGTIEPSS